jgi:nicotinamidase-related amidase
MARKVIRARPSDFPGEGDLDPATTALLVIDLQVDFLSEDGYLARKGYDTAPLRAILPNVNAVIESARKAGCLIIHTRQGHRADLADVMRVTLKRQLRSTLAKTPMLIRSSPGFQIVPKIPIHEDDIIIDKTANGGFTHTDLEHVLHVQGITHLMFAGCTTDVCVHSTLREANDRGFECMLIEDCCASGDAYAHAAAVHMVTVEGGIFGVVSNAGNVIAALNRRWRGPSVLRRKRR